MAGRKPLTQGETKEQKFRRLARYRTNLILEDLRKLGNLSNSNNYVYSSEDINKIFDTIQSSVLETRSLFTARQKRSFRF
jgi:hypothetical protein